MIRDGPKCGHSIFRADGPLCARCKEWWDGHDALYVRLDLSPHHWPAFIPADSGATHAQCELRDSLEAALDDARGMNGDPIPLSSSEEHLP